MYKRQEQGIELCGQQAERANIRQILLITGQWRDPVQTLMRAAVIDLFLPFPQARVDVLKTGDVTLLWAAALIPVKLGGLKFVMVETG